MNFDGMMFAQSETLELLDIWSLTPKAAIQY